MINTETEFSTRNLKLDAYRDLHETKKEELGENNESERISVPKTEIKFRYPKNGLYGLL